MTTDPLVTSDDGPVGDGCVRRHEARVRRLQHVDRHSGRRTRFRIARVKWYARGDDDWRRLCVFATRSADNVAACPLYVSTSRETQRFPYLFCSSIFLRSTCHNKTVNRSSRVDLSSWIKDATSLVPSCPSLSRKDGRTRRLCLCFKFFFRFPLIVLMYAAAANTISSSYHVLKTKPFPPEDISEHVLNATRTEKCFLY